MKTVAAVAALAGVASANMPYGYGQPHGNLSTAISSPTAPQTSSVPTGYEPSVTAIVTSFTTVRCGFTIPRWTLADQTQGLPNANYVDLQLQDVHRHGLHDPHDHRLPLHVRFYRALKGPNGHALYRR